MFFLRQKDAARFNRETFCVCFIHQVVFSNSGYNIGLNTKDRRLVKY